MFHWLLFFYSHATVTDWQSYGHTTLSVPLTSIHKHVNAPTGNASWCKKFCISLHSKGPFFVNFDMQIHITGCCVTKRTLECHNVMFSVGWNANNNNITPFLYCITHFFNYDCRLWLYFVFVLLNLFSSSKWWENFFCLLHMLCYRNTKKSSVTAEIHCRYTLLWK